MALRRVKVQQRMIGIFLSLKTCTALFHAIRWCDSLWPSTAPILQYGLWNGVQFFLGKSSDKCHILIRSSAMSKCGWCETTGKQTAATPVCLCVQIHEKSAWKREKWKSWMFYRMCIRWQYRTRYGYSSLYTLKGSLKPPKSHLPHQPVTRNVKTSNLHRDLTSM